MTRGQIERRLDQQAQQQQRATDDDLQRAIEAARNNSGLFERDFDDLAPARPYAWLLLAWIAIVAALALIFAPRAEGAEVTVGVNLYSWHTPSPYPDSYVYKAWTPGVYARIGEEWFAEAGVYRNSQGFASPHLGGGYSWQWSRFDLSIAAGAVYGYRDWQGWIRPDGSTYLTYGRAELRPFVIPSVGVKLADRWKARAFFIPAAEKDSSYCISIALEKSF
jgi:hypothetical protein